MSKFTSGGVPYPDYDAADSTNFTNQVEFTNDVFVYGKLYAEIDSQDINFDDNQSFKSVTISNDLFVNGGIVGPFATFDCLTVKNKFDVGFGGTVFTAIS